MCGVAAAGPAHCVGVKVGEAANGKAANDPITAHNTNTTPTAGSVVRHCFLAVFGRLGPVSRGFRRYNAHTPHVTHAHPLHTCGLPSNTAYGGR